MELDSADPNQAYVVADHRRFVKEAPHTTVWADALVLLIVAATLATLITVGSQWSEPLVESKPIDLSLGELPRCTLFSLARGLVAYLFSLVFTVVYAKAAAASRRSEKLLIPVLDVLQSIPVLSFMPGLVVALVALFPHSRMGLELACVLSIFTGQVWNMVFSFHAALKAIPDELVEVARLHGFGRMRRLFALEIPSGMTGLVWNSMMSMAGGWFFLTIVESFKIGDRSYRLPGLGSFVATAIERDDGRAIFAAVVAMVLMIVALDQLLWRPILAWAERFKNQESASVDRPTSWFYDVIRRSFVANWLRERRSKKMATDDAPSASLEVRLRAPAVRRPTESVKWRATQKVLSRIVVDLLWAALLFVTAWGGYQLFRLLRPLAPGDWIGVVRALSFTALRVLGALAIGAAWTLPVGILIGRSIKAARIAQPIIQIAASFPAPMIFALMALHLTQAGVPANITAVSLMMLGTQWYLLFNVVAGAVGLPQDLREVTAIFRTPRPIRAVVLYIGGTFPFLVTGLVTASGGAWNASIVSESVQYAGGKMQVDGIGSLIADSFQRGDDSMLAAATVSLSVALVILNRLIWKPLQRVASTRFALNR